MQQYTRTLKDKETPHQNNLRIYFKIYSPIKQKLLDKLPTITPSFIMIHPFEPSRFIEFRLPNTDDITKLILTSKSTSHLT